MTRVHDYYPYNTISSLNLNSLIATSPQVQSMWRRNASALEGFLLHDTVEKNPQTPHSGVQLVTLSLVLEKS